MSAQLGEGLSRLRVGGTTLSRIARIEKIASTAPAAPSRWPIADLVDDLDTFFTPSPNNRRTAPTHRKLAGYGEEVSVAVAYGGRRIIQKQKQTNKDPTQT